MNGTRKDEYEVTRVFLSPRPASRAVAMECRRQLAQQLALLMFLSLEFLITCWLKLAAQVVFI